MPTTKSRSQHERDRTELLRYLVEAGFQPIRPDSLVDHMDEIFQSVSLESVEFHLRYMANLGWVEIGEEQPRGKPARVVFAKITAAGVDELDRRLTRERM